MTGLILFKRVSGRCPRSATYVRIRSDEIIVSSSLQSARREDTVAREGCPRGVHRDRPRARCAGATDAKLLDTRNGKAAGNGPGAARLSSRSARRAPASQLERRAARSASSTRERAYGRAHGAPDAGERPSSERCLSARREPHGLPRPRGNRRGVAAERDRKIRGHPVAGGRRGARRAPGWYSSNAEAP